MKSIMFVCNTYSQLIESIQLRLTTFQDCAVSVIISDHSNNAESIYKRVKQIGIFKNVYYIETKNNHEQINSFFSKLRELNRYVMGKDPLWENLICEEIDELIFYSQTDEIYTLFAKLYNCNPRIKVARYEEGVLSYGDWEVHSQKARIAAIIRHLRKQKALEEVIYGFYCFYPTLYKGNLTPLRIPTIDSSSRVAEVIREIFDIKDGMECYNNYKYIFFSSVYDFEGGKPIGELNTILEIAKFIGNDNLLVKVHPRDNPGRFEERGLHTDKKSNIPWEAIQLGNDFSNHTFLTTNSGSVLSISLIQKNQPQIKYVYPLCSITNNQSAMKTVKSIEALLDSGFAKQHISNIKVINRMEEIVD